MKVLVDTSVWSLALRRVPLAQAACRRTLADLIAGHRAQLIGPIRQELLSGIKDDAIFKVLSAHLSAFPDYPIHTEDYLCAARYFNTCRGRGIQGSHTDFLICAVAARSRMPIFTTDDDFRVFARVLPIRLLD